MTGNDIEVTTRPREAPGGAWSYRPRMDVTESADEYVIFVDMPGTPADGVRVSFDDRTLTIHGTVPARSQAETALLAHEYGVGDFDRQILFPDTVDADRISAAYEHGVLTVRLPKPPERKPRRIEVRTV